MANKESIIQAEIMLAMSEDGLLVKRQHSGVFRALYEDRVINMVMPGLADIGAIKPVLITPEMIGQTIGVAVEVEVKTFMKGSKQAKDQKKYEIAVKSRGGIYTLARSPDEYRAAMQHIVKYK